MQMQMGPDGQLMADGAAVAAAAQAAMAVADPAAAAALAAAAGGEEPSAKRQRRDDGTEEGGEDDGAPMSASDARGTLFGALGGGDATKEAAGATSVNPPLAAMAQQQHEAAAAAAAAQQLGQLPLLYTTQVRRRGLLPDCASCGWLVVVRCSLAVAVSWNCTALPVSRRARFARRPSSRLPLRAHSCCIPPHTQAPVLCLQPGFVMPPGMAEGTPAETKHEGA